MYQFGPYGPKHATAGTFAFKRELIKNRYDEDACLAEEKSFLKDYTVPFVQLDPKKTILVFSHEHNTFDKRKLLDDPHPQFVKESDKKVEDFVKESELIEFYMNINSALETYQPGRPEMKPDVLAQMIKIEEFRRKHAENMLMQQQGGGGQIMIQNADGKPTALNNSQIIEIMKKQQEQLQAQNNQLMQIKAAYEKIARENMELKAQINSKNDTINDLQKINTKIMLKTVMNDD